ncbi:MAG: 16S rRNA processing protein RimM, partial [Clostridia bacterium]|nr:16S rRNA processing protein RimM [Clostridia bacterium]
MQQRIETGRIVTTHGVRGEVKIEPWSDSPETLVKLKTL